MEAEPQNTNHSRQRLDHGREVDNLLQDNQRKTSTWHHKIGIVGLVTLSLSFSCVLAALGFLYFLWLSNSTNNTWQQLVTSGWTTRSITVASILIRVAVTAQATICTSMSAAMLLQKVGITLPHLASVSVARLHNDSPQQLAWAIFAKERLGKGWNLTIPLGILVHTAAFSQFTSTVLLSGVHIDVIVGGDDSLRIPYGIADEGLLHMLYSGGLPHFTQLFWKDKPSVYPSFAEYKTPPVQIEGGGSYDTGETIRAFLPFSTVGKREALREYKGKATLLDSRVVCARPQLEELTFGKLDWEYMAAPVVMGKVGTNVTGNGLDVWCDEHCRRTLVELSETAALSQYGVPNFADPAQSLVPFKCSSAIYSDTNMGVGVDWELPVAICSVGSWTGLLGQFWNSSNILYRGGAGDGMELWDFKSSTLSDLGSRQAYLVIKSTGSWLTWNQLGLDDSYHDLKLKEPFADGEWLTYPVRALQHNVSLSFTLSFLNFDSMDLTIEVSRDSNHTEATVGWSPQQQNYDTAAVRDQLGATNQTNSSPDTSTFLMKKRNLPERLRSAFNIKVKTRVMAWMAQQCGECWSS